MGTRFAGELLKQEFLSREQKLWRSVLVHALEESINQQQDRKSSIFKGEAYVWLITNTKDFKFVCYFGGFDPDNIRIAYERAVSKGEICFTEKQLAWCKYHRQFKIYKNCTHQASRPYHRARVESLRNSVLLATSCLISMVTVASIA